MTNDTRDTRDGASSSLDPADWEDFRRHAHRLLDACIDRLALAADYPWRPVAQDVIEGYRLDVDEPGVGYAQLAEILERDVLPYATGNTHPRFFGWVHGTGLAEGLLAELVAATMNSNCGGRDHGAVYIEREVIDWCARVFGFPSTTSGLLVAGTSQATVIAIAAARQRALGAEARSEGLRGLPELIAYTSDAAHSAVAKAMELVGLGTRSLRRIPPNSEGAMDMAMLAAAVESDRKSGALPFCIIGTAGTVDVGAFDDLKALAEFSQREGLWLHVDGAFGAWTVLAREPWQRLSDGLDQADSLAFDFHKWMYVQYDCGAVLVRDRQAHRAAFESRPTYLARQATGLAGGDPWFCDYGVDLSRGFRALKVWSAIRACGTDAFAAAISRNCELATLMARAVESAPALTLAAPVRLNICCFSAAPTSMSAVDAGRLNERVATQLQLDGRAVFSTTRIADRTVLRAAITNHRTSEADIHHALEGVVEARDRLLQKPTAD